MRIDEYRAKHGLSQEGFGDKLTPKAGQALVSQWELGTTRITLDRAMNIEAVTKKAVTIRDCAAMYGAKKAEAA